MTDPATALERWYALTDAEREAEAERMLGPERIAVLAAMNEQAAKTEYRIERIVDRLHGTYVQDVACGVMGYFVQLLLFEEQRCRVLGVPNAAPRQALEFFVRVNAVPPGLVEDMHKLIRQEAAS